MGSENLRLAECCYNCEHIRYPDSDTKGILHYGECSIKRYSKRMSMCTCDDFEIREETSYDNGENEG